MTDAPQPAFDVPVPAGRPGRPVRAAVAAGIIALGATAGVAIYLTRDAPRPLPPSEATASAGLTVRDARLTLGPPKKAPPAPGGGLTRPGGPGPPLSVAGLPVGRLLADDTFERPEDSLFSDSTSADGRGHVRLVGGLYVMTLPQPGAGWLFWRAGLEPGDHVTQVTARLIGKPGAWGVFTHGVITKACSDGTVEVVPGEWNKRARPSRIAPAKPAEAFEAEKWNTLAVAVRAAQLTVYLNGRQVGGPISSDRGPGSADCGMVLFQDGPGDARAEFRRFTVWELNDKR